MKAQLKKILLKWFGELFFLYLDFDKMENIMLKCIIDYCPYLIKKSVCSEIFLSFPDKIL